MCLEQAFDEEVYQDWAMSPAGLSQKRAQAIKTDAAEALP